MMGGFYQIGGGVADPRAMKKSPMKFSVILFPDEDGYGVYVPGYPEVISWGETPEHAWEMAKECLELILEIHAEDRADDEQVLPGSNPPHVVVGTIDAEVPDVLLRELREEEAAARVNGAG